MKQGRVKKGIGLRPASWEASARKSKSTQADTHLEWVKTQAKHPNPKVLHRGDELPWLERPGLHSWTVSECWLVNKQGVENSLLAATLRYTPIWVGLGSGPPGRENLGEDLAWLCRGSAGAWGVVRKEQLWHHRGHCEQQTKAFCSPLHGYSGPTHSMPQLGTGSGADRPWKNNLGVQRRPWCRIAATTIGAYSASWESPHQQVKVPLPS